MAAAPIYEAHDEDDEDYFEEGVGEDYWVDDQVEAGDEEEGDEDDYGPGVTISWNKLAKSKPAPPVSDVPDEVYSDPMGLVNCWEEALVELKAAHPDRFLPPSDAPRSLSQRQLKAPLWHGPSTSPYPAPIASTSKLPSPSRPASSSASNSSLPPHMISNSYSTNPEPEPTKKRKRLTGSQKKARKAAKLANSGFSNGRVPAAKGSKTRVEDHDEEGDEAGSKSPEYRPQSPEFAPQPENANGEPPVQFALPTQPIPQPRSTSPQEESQPPQPLAVKPSAAGRLPLTFPAPPPITPLTGSEPALDPESPESLLESALWSWYTAGYQTALYHASVGVATFKPSENGMEGGGEE